MTSRSSAAQTPRPGSEYRIGRYRVRARLGKGGMGVVYLGRDEALDRDVAIKTLRLEGSPDDESRGRFEIEAKAAARLQHPNIVTVFELGEDRGLPYIAMELLGGQDLEALLRSGEKLGAAERIDVVIQTLRGLDFAHAHQIVHRDMKPSNIRVLDDGGVKILDFGIAKVESTSVTRAGMMVGTPFYMSPEHIRGGVLDGRTDVFALGVILHELFAGKRPFTADDPTRVLYRIVNEPHPRLPENAGGALTADIQAVIDKALEKDASSRYGSAALMADDLARIRERWPGSGLSAEESMALSQARKSLAAGRLEPENAQAVEGIAAAHPEAAEAQRLKRLLKRKPAPRPEMDSGSFPELDATFGAASVDPPQTVVSGRTINGRADTIQQGGGASGSVPASRSNLVAYIVGGASVLALGLAAALYLNRPVDGGAPPRPSPTVTEIFVPANTEAPGAKTAAPEAPKVAAPVSVPKVALEVRSQPPGASIRIDRKAVGVTPLRIEIAAGASHTVSLALAGYKEKEVRIDPPLPRVVETTLAADGPPSTLVVESAYPVTVTVSGRVVGSDKPGLTATVAAGSHEVLLESPSVFYKHRETVQFDASGSFTIRTPGTGKLGVRANPDNCKVFVDGVFVDYPPILDRAIAAGSHKVTWEWPDGVKSEETIVIQAGRPSYLQGRKP